MYNVYKCLYLFTISKFGFKIIKMTIYHLKNIKRNRRADTDFKLDTRIKISLGISKNQPFIFVYEKK